MAPEALVYVCHTSDVDIIVMDCLQPFYGYIEGVSQNLRMLNGRFKTPFIHFSPIT